MKKRERSCAQSSAGLRSPFLFLCAGGNYRDSSGDGNMSRRYRQGFIDARSGPFPARLCLPSQVFVDASAVLVPELAPERAGRSENKIAATVIVGCAGTPHSTPDGRRSTKKICRDDPRGARGGNFSFWPWSALSIAATLRLPLLLAVCGLAIASPGLPRPPLPRPLAARLTAIARPWLLGPELPPTALQQTPSAPRTTSTRLGPQNTWELIFRRS